MKICFYAINGHGLGHLSRCHAIGKKLRCLLEMLAIEADIQFLTTSEADYIIRDFPVFKIPSRASFKGRKAAASRYASNGKMMVSNMLAHFSPDLLVMDTIAQGSFQELSFIKDFAKKKVLIDRHKKEHFNGDRSHKAHLILFDKILVPDEPINKQDYQYDEALHHKVKFVGKIHNFERETAWERDKVRAFFNVADHQRLIYISAGGGGDTEASLQLSKLIEALAPSGHKIIIGYGALSQVDKIYGDSNIISLTEPGACKYFSGVDLAISAAGYNTYEELLAAKVNSLFFIQDKGMDLQERRVTIGLEKQWHGVVDLGNSLEELRSIIAKQLSEGISAELSEREGSNGDLTAAFEMFSCYFIGNVELKLEANMAKVALLHRESQEWLVDDPIESFRLWKFYVTESEGVDTWQEMCLASMADKHISEENRLSLNVLTSVTGRLQEVGLSHQQKRACIKHVAREGVTKPSDPKFGLAVMEIINTYLAEKNYVD